jgi:hypothetical protein
MKKTATLLGAFALSLLSLEGFSQVKLGVKAGLNASSFAYDLKDSDDEKEEKDATKPKLGFHIGVAADFELSEKLSLQSGLMWTNKGTKQEVEEDDFEYKSTMSLNYLEIPVNVAYKISNFQIHAGPYVAFGIGGKVDTEFTMDGDTDKEDYDVKFKNTLEESDFEDDDDVTFVRGLDYGLNFGVGYMAGPVLLSANYSLGMANLNPKIDIDGYDDDSEDNKVTNRVFGVSATYFFGGK